MLDELEPNPVDELPSDVRRELQDQCSTEEELIQRARDFLAAQDEDAMREAAEQFKGQA